MKKIVAISSIVLLAATGCGSTSGKTVTVNMNSLTNSKESGAATLKEANGQTVITLDLTGAPKDIAQPAHILSGACNSLGPVKYALNYPVNGKSSTTFLTTIDNILSQSPLVIDIQQSTTQSGVHVSCGDLKK